MNKKEVIYIDVEDDITAILEKVNEAKASIVALVPPKRSQVLQSAVNLKLLKKSAAKSKKRIVLISSDPALIPLAGLVSVHIAKNLQSRPEIPPAPANEPDATIIEEEPGLDKSKAMDEIPEEPKIDNKKAKKKDDKNVKVPNFNKFRKRLIFGGMGLAIILIAWLFAFVILPKADIRIVAKTSDLDHNFAFSMDTSIEESDMEKKVLVGKAETVKKTLSEDFKATGEKNVGEKSKGTITVTNNCYNPGKIAQGTSFTSNSGLVFVSTEQVPVPDAVPNAGSCDAPSTVDVPVVARKGGDQYNLAPTGYSVAGISGDDLSGFGSQMSGGTNKVVKVVTEEDVNSASNALLERDNNEIIDELQESFGEDVFIIQDTLRISHSDPTSEPKVGEEAEEGKVSAEFTFKLIGVDKSELDEILRKSEQEQISASEQTILDSGINDAQTAIIDGAGSVKNIELTTTAQVGPEFDEEALAKEVEKKRFGEARTALEAKTGVESVEITLSPSWVFSLPKASKINITVEVAPQP